MIRYRLHFLLLIVAALAFRLAEDVDLSIRIAGVNHFLFVLMGVLHATALVVSLRSRKAHYVVSALSFVILAAVWSAATPMLALASWPLWNLLPEGGPRFVSIFVIGSAVGSAGYWLLVRLFWLKSLRRVDCFRTVLLCVAATLLSFPVNMLDQSGKHYYESLFYPAAWWFAFSISLYWSEMSGLAKKSTPAMASAS